MKLAYVPRIDGRMNPVIVLSINISTYSSSGGEWYIHITQ